MVDFNVIFGKMQYYEILSYFVYSQISYGDVMGKTLVFAVYDFDRFSKHDAIGELRLPVCQLDLASSKDIWKDLQSIQGDGVVSINICLNLTLIISLCMK